MPEPTPIRFIVSIDTEEDNWSRSRERVTLDNIAELRRQARFFDRLGIRPTYFTTYQVAGDARAVDVIRDVSRGGAEIGAHLHPWNTPPLTEAFTPRNSMLKNLPAALQEQKLQALTEALEEAFGARPRAFRAGRYGLGRDTVGVLLRGGYSVDSSVTPFVTWKSFDDGPSFDGAPLDIYRLAPDRDVTLPADDGALTEVPLSCGFSRGPFAMWGRVRRALDTAALRRLRLVGLAARTGLCKRIMLSPEVASGADMLTLSRRLIERGIRHLHLSWHSPSLKPGLSPFTRTTADVERLYATVEAYVEDLSKITSLTFSTVSEAAAVEAAAC